MEMIKQTTFKDFMASRKKESSINFSARIGMDPISSEFVYVYLDGYFIEIKDNGGFFTEFDRMYFESSNLLEVETKLWNDFVSSEVN